MTISIFATFTFFQLVLAHEGHHVPGSLPPPPNGGRVVQAIETTDHQSKGHDSKEANHFCFEASYKEGAIRIYPLLLPKKDPTSFSPVPIADVSDLMVKVDVPQEKRTTKLSMRPTDGAFVGVFNSGKAHRFTVKISGKYHGEIHQANVQLEQE